MPPQETMKKMREQASELNRLLSEQAAMLYNAYLLQTLPRMLGQQETQPPQPQQPQKTNKDEISERIKEAYSDALAIKAYQTILGAPSEVAPEKEKEKEEEREEKEEETDLGAELRKAVTDLIKTDPKAAVEFLKNMDEEARENLRLLASITGKNPLLALASFKSTKEEKPKSEPTDMAKTILDAIKTGIEIGRPATPPQDQQGQIATTLLNALIEILKERRDEESKRLLAGIYESLERRENVWEKILTDENFRKNLQALFVGPQVPPDALLKLEELRNQLTREELDLRKWMAEKKLELANEQRKTKLIENLLSGNVGKYLSDLGKAAIGGLAGGAAGATVASQQFSQVKTPQTSTSMPVKCGVCGAVFQVPEGTERMTCPSCNTELELKAKKQAKHRKKKVEEEEKEPEASETLQ